MSERPIAKARWLAKKAARAACGVLGPTKRGIGVRVLTYHRFGPARRMPFTVTAEAFAREMAFLAETRRAVALGDVEAFVAGERPLRDGAVLVSIDDGDPSVRAVALPILARSGVPAVVYALSGRPAGFDVMSPAELRELHAAGIAIGSHSATHRSMARLSPGEARTEARRSKEWLEDVLGTPVTSFAYPFGTRGDISEPAARMLADVGYRTAFTSQHGALTGPGERQNPMLLPRIKVESGDPSWLFPRLCDGAMDAWRIVDGGLQGFQTPQRA